MTKRYCISCASEFPWDEERFTSFWQIIKHIWKFHMPWKLFGKIEDL